MKKELFFLVLLLLLLNFLLLVFMHNGKKEIRLLQSNVEVCIEKQQKTEDLFVQSVLANRGKLNPDLPVISITNDTSAIADIIGQGKLVFMFRKVNCNVCVSKEVQLLNKYTEKFGKKNIVILATVDYVRYLISFEKVNNLKMPIYYLEHDLAKTIIGDYNKPFYCMVDSDLNISNIFIPDEENPELTVKYFELIKSILPNG